MPLSKTKEIIINDQKSEAVYEKTYRIQKISFGLFDGFADLLFIRM